MISTASLPPDGIPSGKHKAELNDLAEQPEQQQLGAVPALYRPQML